METFEFVVTSIARVTLKEHVKIQAEGVEDAITRIKDNDYYEEDGEILSREYELIDYESTEDIMDWERKELYREIDMMLIGQLIEILKQYDLDREVMIHTLKGENVEVNGYFIPKNLDESIFYLTDLDVIPRN